MEAREEAQSLKENPLPEEQVQDPLYTVIMMDIRIREAREEIEYCTAVRQNALDYAIAHKVETEGKLRLVSDVKQPNQKVNVDKLRAEKPETFTFIQGLQRRYLVEKVREQFRTLGNAVTIAELKKALPLKATHEMFLHRPGEPTVTYSVVSD